MTGMGETKDRSAVGTVVDWEQYWTERGWRWRTEPEINYERKELLLQRLQPSNESGQGLQPLLRVRQLGDRVSLFDASTEQAALDNPFANFELSRADIEWMLANHEGGKGPVIWDDGTQRQRIGLNLRGALVQGINLSGLPLARTLFTDAHLESCNLVGTHLEGSDIERAHFEGANLAHARMQFAVGMGVNLQGSMLYEVDAQETALPLARFEAADLRLANFQKASLRSAHFAGAIFMRAHFEGADCTSSFFVPSVDSAWEHSRSLISALPKQLQGADLRGVFFDSATTLAGSVMFNITTYQTGVQLADVHWGDVNIADISWNDQLPAKGPLLGDELAALRLADGDPFEALQVMVASVRANRQLAVELRDQGLNEEADKFAYRAQFCQKCVLLKRHRYGGYLLSHVLDLIAGYGYLPLRTLYTYIGIILVFAAFYLLASQFTTPHLSVDEAIVLSMSSFHGRGFFNQQVQLGDAYARLAAAEALTGLLTEVSFIATFTQRFLGK